MTYIVRRIKSWQRNTHFLCWDHVFVCLMIYIIGGLLAFASINFSIFSPMKRALEDFSMTDVYYEIQRGGELDMNSDIVLVDMTRQRMRGDIARTIHEINKCRPKVLVIDIIFEREGDDTMGNIDLINAINERRENTVLSCKLTGYDPSESSFRNRVCSFFSAFDDYNWAYGNVVQTHSGGCIRRYSLSQKFTGEPIYSLPYKAACMYSGVKPSAEEPNERIIVYGNTDFPVVQYDEVAQNSSMLKDKIVILGTISSEEDSHVTPIGKMAGMKIQAYSIQSYLEHRTINQMSLGMSLFIAFLLCYLSAWVGYMISRTPPPACLYTQKFYYCAMAALLAWISFICFVKFGYNVNLLYPLLGMALVEEARLHYKWIVATFQSSSRWRFADRSIYKMVTKKKDEDE
ncbi:MAG: CHASE2 domain-containing protein [Prevotella sp.]|nr:CHASE2 domain-containing protein [Prevotella sp.]